MFTETWYHNNSNYYHIPSYRSFILNRKQRRGRGVAMYVNAVSTAARIADFRLATTDYDVLTIQTNCMINCVYYRPPDADVTLFLCFL